MKKRIAKKKKNEELLVCKLNTRVTEGDNVRIRMYCTNTGESLASFIRSALRNTYPNLVVGDYDD